MRCARRGSSGERRVDRRPDPGPERSRCRRHRRQQRPRADHGARARPRGGKRRARLPQHRQGRRRAARADGRGAGGRGRARRMGRINLDDLNGERRYRRWRAYGQSKLANLLFALELDRRLRASGSTVKSLAAHPGYAATNLQSAAAPVLDRAVMAVSKSSAGAGRGGRGPVAALRGYRAGARGWHLRGAGRAGRATRPPPTWGGPDKRRPRRGRGRATMGGLGGGDRRPLRPGRYSAMMGSESAD